LKTLRCARQLLPARQLCPGPLDRGFLFKQLTQIRFPVWHNACEVSFDDGLRGNAGWPSGSKLETMLWVSSMH
jgi:hypothetical protein